MDLGGWLALLWWLVFDDKHVVVSPSSLLLLQHNNAAVMCHKYRTLANCYGDAYGGPGANLFN